MQGSLDFVRLASLFAQDDNLGGANHRTGAGSVVTGIDHETITICAMPPDSNVRLDRVLAQLRLYEHPLLTFNAHAKDDGVEVSIQLMHCSVPVHTYLYELHPRDLDHPQFEWQFQRQLYDALHDYLVEMFIRTPQDRVDRRERGL
jgi:hypothetical protein